MVRCRTPLWASALRGIQWLLGLGRAGARLKGLGSMLRDPFEVLVPDAHIDMAGPYEKILTTKAGRKDTHTVTFVVSNVTSSL
jgi:hypothetical protein